MLVYMLVYMIAHLLVYVLVNMLVDMIVDMIVNVCVDVFVDKLVNNLVNMFVGTCVDMVVGAFVGTCAPYFPVTSSRSLALAVYDHKIVYTKFPTDSSMVPNEQSHLFSISTRTHSRNYMPCSHASLPRLCTLQAHVLSA